MSNTGGTIPPPAILGLGLDTGGPCYQRAVQRSRAMVRTYLLSSSVPPLPLTGGTRLTKNPLRLPSIATTKGPRRPTTAAPLSFSEHSLITLGERSVFEGFSRNRHPSALQKRGPAPPPPPPAACRSSPLTLCKSCEPLGRRQSHQTHPVCHHDPHLQVQSCSRPSYTHFTQPIQPTAKPTPVKPHSHSQTLGTEGGVHRDLRPLVMQYRHSISTRDDTLSVVGRPCLPSCSHPLTLTTNATAAPTRTQLHVFLPTEGPGPGEEADSESVDEGFMDELDSKITTMKLQQGTPKALTYPE